jgi:hypothetical protein
MSARCCKYVTASFHYETVISTTFNMKIIIADFRRKKGESCITQTEKKKLRKHKEIGTSLRSE